MVDKLDRVPSQVLVGYKTQLAELLIGDPGAELLLQRDTGERLSIDDFTRPFHETGIVPIVRPLLTPTQFCRSAFALSAELCFRDF